MAPTVSISRAHARESRMTQPNLGCPFQEFDRGDETRLEPAARVHLVRCHAFAPAPGRAVRQVPERASKSADFRERGQQRLACAAIESGAHRGGVLERSPVIVTHEDRIEVVRARYVATDHELANAVCRTFTHSPERLPGR